VGRLFTWVGRADKPCVAQATPPAALTTVDPTNSAHFHDRKALGARGEETCMICKGCPGRRDLCPCGAAVQRRDVAIWSSKSTI